MTLDILISGNIYETFLFNFISFFFYLFNCVLFFMELYFVDQVSKNIFFYLL